MNRRILFTLVALGTAGVAFAAVPRLVPQSETPAEIEHDAERDNAGNAEARGHHGHHRHHARSHQESGGEHHARDGHRRDGHHGRHHGKSPGEHGCSN